MSVPPVPVSPVPVSPRQRDRRPPSGEEDNGWLARIVPPVVVLVMLLALWQGLTWYFQVKAYLLPSPLAVAQAGWRIRRELLVATGITARAALAGFGLSVVTGSAIALLFARFPWLRRGCFPFAVTLQTVPMIAIAPLLITALGAGFLSVVTIVFIVSVFPILANVTTGLTSVAPGYQELFTLYHATRWQITWKLQVPHAIPHLVTGARTASGMAVIGAIVGEFFAGDLTGRDGLGFLINRQIGMLHTAEALAGVLAATALGIGLFLAVGAVRRWGLAKWCDAAHTPRD